MPTSTDTTNERRKRALRAVLEIEAMPVMRAGPTPVRAIHVLTFNVSEPVDVPSSTMSADLLWLERAGYLLRPRDNHAEYVSTEAGQRWAR